MKHLFAFLIAITLTLSSFAQDISETVAISAATNFFNRNIGRHLNASRVTREYKDSTLCLYFVTFSDSSWSIVSASSQTMPILAYGDSTDVVGLEPHEIMMNCYKDYVINQIISRNTDSVANLYWQDLRSGGANPKGYNYVLGRQLLDETGRGSNIWGQTKNNQDGCEPSYNQECPQNYLGSDGDCGHRAVGCGAVAMGQVLWYWNWAKSSSRYWNTKWDLLPPNLYPYTPSDQVSELTHFLRNCGTAVNMNYISSTGSWCTMGNIEDALIDTFGYECSRIEHMDSWKYKDSWVDLIRSEIDNGRPVIYYGDNGLFFGGHYFIVDGYKFHQCYYFHVNFGHNGTGGYYLLHQIRENDDYYNRNLKAIVGISPTYEYNVDELPYDIVNFHHNEFAANDINIPEENHTYVVRSDKNVSLNASHAITLSSGFHASRGANVSCRIVPELSSGMYISVNYWPNAMILPNSNGLTINVDNADSWECTITQGNSNNVIYQSAGLIQSNNICIWDGENVAPDVSTYVCKVKFKNSFGRILENTFSVVVINGAGDAANSEGEIEDKGASLNDYETVSLLADDALSVYPNPSTGRFNIKVDGDTIMHIVIYDSNGNLCYTDKYYNSDLVELNLSKFHKGVYVAVVESANKKYIQKLIIN